MNALSKEERAQIIREWNVLQEGQEHRRHEEGSLDTERMYSI